MMRFLHSGDMGDIVFSLPAIDVAGGGMLILDESGGATNPHVQRQFSLINNGVDRNKFGIRQSSFLRPLLLTQPCIQSLTVCNGNGPGHDVVDLNVFRQRACAGAMENIATMHLKALGLYAGLDPFGWLQNIHAGPAYRLVVSRSLRVQGNFNFWWTHRRDLIGDDVAFVGTDLEYDAFCEALQLPNLRRELVSNAYELASVIKAAGEFRGNQSLAAALAFGVGHPRMVIELDVRTPSSLFPGRALYV